MSPAAPLAQPEPLPVCHSLAAALAEDPFYLALTIEAADHPARLDMLARYFAVAMAEAEIVGEARLAGGDGAALWRMGEVGEETIRAAADMRMRALWHVLGKKGVANFRTIGVVMAEQLPADLTDAWYLSILGVRPGAQGQGIARGLLSPTLARADRAGKLCYLESFNAASLAFYRRQGFSGARRLHDPVTDRDYWLLWRPPGSDA